MLASYAEKRAAGEMDPGYVNYFAGQVLEECDDLAVVREVATWMGAAAAEEPAYDYHKRHAMLLAKAGDDAGAARAADLAAAQAAEEGKDMEKVEAALSVFRKR